MWQKDGYREMMHEKLTGKCNGMYGKHHSAETRALISEHRKGISVYYSLSEEKKAELKAELSEKFSGVKNPAHAKHWWHKNDEYIFANECPGEGWELGGRHCSKETADKIRKANSGRKFTEEHRKKISEAAKARDPKKNGMYGKHHSQESIEKMKKTREERKNTYAVWNKGLKLKPLSDEQKHVLSDKMSNMFWWNDGKINKRFRECPGEGWIKGRLKRVN